MNLTCISCTQRLPSTFSFTRFFTLAWIKSEMLPPIHHWLCTSCREQMTLLTGGCKQCFRSYSEEAPKWKWDEDEQLCYDCQRWIEWEKYKELPKLLESNCSVFRYNDWAKALVKKYKFDCDERLKYFFASLVVEQWKRGYNPIALGSVQQIDVVCPVPLSCTRAMERGFNQSGHVAKLFAQEMNYTYCENLLLLLDEEKKQSKKGRQERMTEMFQKFIKNPDQLVDIHNKTILLIDDIYTTGATVYAAAYPLMKAGAKQVCSFTLAR